MKKLLVILFLITLYALRNLFNIHFLHQNIRSKGPEMTLDRLKSKECHKFFRTSPSDHILAAPPAFAAAVEPRSITYKLNGLHDNSK